MCASGHGLNKSQIYPIIYYSLIHQIPNRWEEGVHRKNFHQWFHICHIWKKNKFFIWKTNTLSLTEKKNNLKMGNQINSENIPSSDTLFKIKA